MANGVEKAMRRKKQLSHGPCFIHFVRAAESAAVKAKSRGVLATASDCELQADLKFPELIARTSLRPDIVLWSARTKQVVLADSTLGRENGGDP